MSSHAVKRPPFESAAPSSRGGLGRRGDPERSQRFSSGLLRCARNDGTGRPLLLSLDWQWRGFDPLPKIGARWLLQLGRRDRLHARQRWESIVILIRRRP